MPTSDPSQRAFESAKRDFREKLKDEKLFQEILRTRSIDEVWKAANELQAKPHAERRLRNLGKLGGFLDKLEGYASTVDKFVQVKPEILALIWGPIHLLMVWTGNITQFADAISSVMMKVGDALPRFVEASKIFRDTRKLEEVLALFYRDILDVYIIALEFFNLPRPKIIFESIWPQRTQKINVVIRNIERHVSVMREDTTQQHIMEEFEAQTKALAHFEKEIEFQEIQKFEMLKTRICPPMYDDRLDWLLNRSCEGSATWLFNEEIFLEWLDVSNSTVRLLWLRGIPGAGKCKTFLAAAAIEQAKARHHQTLLIFASHVDQSITTARSIFQSLLFQLAFESIDVRSILVQSKQRDLLASTKYVSELLKTVLNSVGPTYIIIDGLDEMDHAERKILLQLLLSLDDCPETNILLCSRPEDDITKALESKAPSIRVEKRNSGAIQSYVSSRTRDWMCSEGFDQKSREQVQSLLAPLVSKAEGMFLYVRIVFDNAELFKDPEEIKNELRILPLDLNDAYFRIFARINKLPRALRQKARKILGWIGCTPFPMTRREMEQALLIDSDHGASPSVVANEDFPRICGPIVEVVDDSPQFVHFTVKEYIFSRDICDYINNSEANYSLTKSLLVYFCSGIYGLDVSDEELQENVIAGRYRLHWFATSQWIALVRRCIEVTYDLSTYPDLLELLLQMTEVLQNNSFKNHIEYKDVTFQGIQSRCSEVSQVMCGILQFRQDKEQADWNYTNGSKWLNSDPLVISSMSIRIFGQIEDILCDERVAHKESCPCAKLHQHYGAKIFKCTYPSCGLASQGFRTRRDRDTHVKQHSRPWKCTEPSCEYHSIGFETTRAQDVHWQKVHAASTHLGPLDLTPDQFTRDDVQILLYETTKTGNVNELRRIAQHFDAKMDSYVLGPATILAATKGSLPMVDILTQGEKPWPIYLREHEFIRAVVGSESLDLFRWFLSKICSLNHFTYDGLATAAFTTNSPDIYAEWEIFLLDNTRDICNTGHKVPKAAMLLPQYRKREVLFNKVAFNAIKNNAVFEARLIQTWHRLIDVLRNDALGPRTLGWSLVCLAQSSNHSITLGAELLRLGAPINFPRMTSPTAIRIVDSEGNPQPASKVTSDKQTIQKGITALHHASRHASEQGVQFVKFLLENGADPNYGWGAQMPANEEGAKLMQKWLGETWHQVVKRTKGARVATNSRKWVWTREVSDDSEQETQNAKRHKIELK